ncbi:radical SAM family heme chaperone HemW [Bifidobacterium sp. ESL0763]|uniref:radical SAM family heme chaperone HemW n=1 Tax=Bifidobacterium sp. ESL0763 TaxID=2983227 RepID=UPI0023FA2697|nr:radical SAM family heme chaperone HemW [Bifidobacterium sp. ESL0763]MDF7663878.1 radical SAM family heme chaperone HemW [Bifidobacterium sp. ESL0763]
MFEVYIHVPFCYRRCGYCDFNTYTAVDMGGGASRGNYANLAIGEMRLVRAWQERHGIDEPAASTVFFGGGTPTLLPAEDLGRMLQAVRETWGIQDGAEVTTEANPDTVDERYLETLAAAGFTRVSFGMQSAVPHVLKTLDRTHTPANVVAGVRAANKVGLRSSVDLIYGAPGESMDDWRTSVETAIELGVNHISAYALTVEPTTKMGRQIKAGQIAKPDDDDEAAKYELADDLFSQAGLQWYEISNWARPGYESRHNLGYWRNVDWAGIGPGAHSHYRTSNVGAWQEHADGGARDVDENGFRKTGLSQAGNDGPAMGADSGTSLAGVESYGVEAEIDDRTSDGSHGDCIRQNKRSHDIAGEDESSDIGTPSSGNVSGVAGSGLGDCVDNETGGRSDDNQFGIRAWDIAHPRKWAEAMAAGAVPWAGSEAITHGENLEETVMLGLRLHEGLDISRVEQASGRAVDGARLAGIERDGLIEIRDGGRIVPTRQGRLLNDTVIAEVLDICGW